MTKSERGIEIFYQACNKELQTKYLISIEECGLTAFEWHQRYGDWSANDAVKTFVQKYDLQHLNVDFW